MRKANSRPLAIFDSPTEVLLPMIATWRKIAWPNSAQILTLKILRYNEMLAVLSTKFCDDELYSNR